MALIPRSFFDFDNLFDDERLSMRNIMSRPAMNLYETEDKIVAEVNVPGFNPDQIDISVENGILRVVGKSEEKKEEKEKGYWRKEIRTGSFERAVRIPMSVEEDKTEASYEKGILKIVMPKAKKDKGKSKIKIQSKE